MPEQTIAAFFDLDGTLLTVNSGRLWMKRERRHNRISRWQMTQGLLFLAAYRFGIGDMDRLMRKALTTIQGEPEDHVRQWTHEWFQAEVTPFVSPGARAVIEQHRLQKHRLVLLTSSSPYESEIACEHFGLDEFLCTRYQVVNGRFTGQVEKPICYGAGKVTWAEQLARRRGLDLSQSYFYSDSFTDLPMLKRVGHPVAVHPDPRLRRVSLRNRWPVLDWR
jgi:HAD superfamily hydrolase (TIGR01490 family)